MPLEPGQLSFPLGLGYLAAHLRGRGHKVKVLDMYARQMSKSQIERAVKELDTDFVGIGAFSTQYTMVKWLAALIKKHHPDMKIILGGPIATLGYRLALEKTLVDVCVIGEGETTAAELLDMPDGADLSTLPGVAFRGADGKIFVTPSRTYIKNLDELPMPEYSLFDMDKYLHTVFMQTTKGNVRARIYGMKVMAVLTGRGCPYNCQFCSKNFEGVRLRGMDSVIEEIKYLQKTYGIHGVHFIDELAIVNKKRVAELSAKIKPLDIVFDCQARVNVVDKEMLAQLKDAGCLVVGFGIESGSQKILDAMNKRQTIAQTERAMEACRELDLEVKVQLIFGYPGEDADTVLETVEMFRRLRHPGRRFNILAPLPGTPIYDMALKQGFITDEEEYLKSLACDFGGNRIKANFTSFPDGEYLSRKRAAEREMEENFIAELQTRPEEWRAWRREQARDKFAQRKTRIMRALKNPALAVKKLREKPVLREAAQNPSALCAICGHRELCAELGVKKY